MIFKNLIKLANELDKIGMSKEASYLDSIMATLKKEARPTSPEYEEEYRKSVEGENGKIENALKNYYGQTPKNNSSTSSGYVAGPSTSGGTPQRPAPVPQRSMRGKVHDVLRSVEPEALRRYAPVYTYTASLEQTSFIKKNVKGFYITVVSGNLFDKIDKNLVKQNYLDEPQSNQYVPATSSCVVKGTSKYPDTQSFVPYQIAINIIFNDGNEFALYAPAQANPYDGTATAVFTEQNILAKFKQKYPRAFDN